MAFIFPAQFAGPIFALLIEARITHSCRLAAMHKYASFLIAIIIILVVVLVAVLYRWFWSGKSRSAGSGWRVAPRSAEQFLLGDPATPRVRAQMGNMQAVLTALVGVGGSFDRRTQMLMARLHGRSAIAALQPVLQTQPAIQKMIRGLRHASTAITTVPRTHVNSLSFYRGLCASDTGFSQFADDIEAQGHEALRRVQTVPPPAELAEEVPILAKDLLRIGNLVRRLVGTCHSLGAALDLE